MMEKNTSSPSYMLSQAARSGQLELVNWLLFVGPKRYRVPMSDLLLDDAARSGNLELLQFLMCSCRENARLCPSMQTLAMAAQSGNQAMVQWLCEGLPESQCLLPNQGVLNHAAISGNKALFQWLFAFSKNTNRSLSITQKTWRCACASGNLAFVQWLWLSFRDHYLLVIDHSILDAAVSSQQFPLVKWLMQEAV